MPVSPAPPSGSPSPEATGVLWEIAAAAAGERDLETILSTALDRLRKVIRFTGGSVALVEGDRLVVRAAAGPFAAQALGQSLPRGEGRLWTVVETRRPFLSNDLPAAGLTPSTPIRSYLAMPLTRGGQVFGTLEVDSTEPGVFDRDDAALLARVAQLLSGAVELAVRHVAETEALARAESLADRLARLQAVTAALAGALTPSQIAEVVVGEGISAAGAMAGSLSITRDGRTLELVRAVGYPEAFLAEWARVPIEARPAAAEALRGGGAIFFASAEAMTASVYPPTGDPFALLPYPGARAILPLRGPRGILGVLSFVFPGPRGFSEEDRAFFGTLGDQCAQALDRAARYEHEHHVAETLQRALLPPALPELPGLTLRAAYRSGGQLEVGGDWYDAFVLPDGRIVVGIGDVVGRGLDAAVVMGQVRQSIRAVALTGAGPAAILDHAGLVLSQAYGSDGMATAVVGIVDPGDLSLTYAVAGHPAPLIALPDGRIDRLAGGGPPLGVLGDVGYPEVQTVLPAGSTVVMYTDGLVESSRDAEAADATLLRAVGAEAARPSSDRAAAIMARAAAEQRLVDDLAIVTLHVAVEAADRFNVRLPSDPSSLARVRPALRRLAAHAGLDAERTMALLVASSEAIANAVLHAYPGGRGAIDVRARRDAVGLLIEVEDHGRWREPRRDGGHGLSLMRRLADDCAIETGAAGTLVRLRIAAAARAGDTVPV